MIDFQSTPDYIKSVNNDLILVKKKIMSLKEIPTEILESILKSIF